MGVCFNLALVAIFTTVVFAEHYMPRNKRAIGIFNVVKFPNDACDSNSASMNGTCYTSEECASKGGTASGECAEGYGVCCVLTVACAGSTSENGTYLSQAASTEPATDSTTSQSCTYTICPITSSVNRIKLDLTEFSIAGPGAPTSTNGDAVGSDSKTNVIGKCITDSFSVTGAPVICGANMGQHLIVDSDGLTCITAAFSFGLSSTTSRSYTIQVSQFESTNEMGGPPGCLQFFTGDEGTVSTFNWSGVAGSTHLANQNYDICVRQAIDKCVICWSAATSGTAAIRGSFGISNAASTDGTPMGGVGAECVADAVPASLDSNDQVIIPNGQTEAAAKAFPITVAEDAFCGRFLAPASSTAEGTVCSAVTPFTLGVRFDGFEAVAAAQAEEAAAMEAKQEPSGTAGSNGPLGTQGFSLGFTQVDC